MWDISYMVINATNVRFMAVYFAQIVIFVKHVQLVCSSRITHACIVIANTVPYAVLTIPAKDAM
jgi:hypothetical protein